jgi:UDP-2,3-diacylglucosamine pyrophosphatase LpxH
MTSYDVLKNIIISIFQFVKHFQKFCYLYNKGSKTVFIKGNRNFLHKKIQNPQILNSLKGMDIANKEVSFYFRQTSRSERHGYFLVKYLEISV